MPIIKKGFTLVELLIVITLMGLLAAFGTQTYLKSQQRSRDGRRQADLEAIRSALEIYRYDQSAYPATLVSLVPDYISAIAVDPQNPTRLYPYSTTGLTYILCAGLEATTTAVAGCGSCGTGITCSYKLTNP